MSEVKSGKKVSVMEIFGPTIQGEGHVIGQQTMFIRFGGCDYRCTMCDSLHAVLPESVKKHGKMMWQQNIFDQLEEKAGHCRTVTLSGGNPCMWDISELIANLQSNGWDVFVETQGTLWQDWLKYCRHVTVSPKGPGMGEKFEPGKFDAFVRMLQPWHDDRLSIKVVIFDQRDIEFAKEFAKRYPLPLYLSIGNPFPPPSDMHHSDVANILLERMTILWEDVKNEPLLSRARLLPQLHVLAWGNKQGV